MTPHAFHKQGPYVSDIGNILADLIKCLVLFFWLRKENAKNIKQTVTGDVL